MPANAYEAYLESRILTADPVELVHLLYGGAVDNVRQARQELREGRIRERSEAVTRASDILNELALSVNLEAGGEVARNLVELYDYLQRLLIDANSRQQDAPLEEAESLLITLAGAWHGCQPSPSAAPAASGTVSPPAVSEYDSLTGAPPGYTPLRCTY